MHPPSPGQSPLPWPPAPVAPSRARPMPEPRSSAITPAPHDNICTRAAVDARTAGLARAMLRLKGALHRDAWPSSPAPAARRALADFQDDGALLRLPALHATLHAPTTHPLCRVVIQKGHRCLVLTAAPHWPQPDPARTGTPNLRGSRVASARLRCDAQPSRHLQLSPRPPADSLSSAQMLGLVPLSRLLCDRTRCSALPASLPRPHAAPATLPLVSLPDFALRLTLPCSVTASWHDCRRGTSDSPPPCPGLPRAVRPEASDILLSDSVARSVTTGHLASANHTACPLIL